MSHDNADKIVCIHEIFLDSSTVAFVNLTKLGEDTSPACVDAAHLISKVLAKPGKQGRSSSWFSHTDAISSYLVDPPCMVHDYISITEIE
jgi:hypothetical protein